MTYRTLALAALALAACSSDPTSASLDRRSRTGLAGSLRLDVAVSPERLSLGDTARIEVSLTNTADTAVTLHFPSGCQLHYVVEHESGRAVPQEGGGYACTQALTALHLPAGATERHEFRWTHTQFLYPPSARAFQPAGRYRVYGMIFGHAEGPEALSEIPATLEVIDTATYGAKPNVAISLSPTRARVRPGDTVSVDVVLRNLSAESVTMRFTSTCQFRFEVYESWRRPGDAPVSVVGDACGDALTSLTLGPLATRTERVVWRAVDRSGAPLRTAGYALYGTLGTHAPERLLQAPVSFLRVEP